MLLKTINNAEIEGKRVLLRCDLDVPLNEDGSVNDDTRLKLAIGTIEHLLLNKAKQIIIMGHVGRPKGVVVEKLRTKRIASRLQKLLSKRVAYAKNLDVLPEEQIVVIENLRFWKEEKEDDKEFAQKLANLGDVYVNDAFAVSHRKHASVHEITNYIPSYAGLHLKYELETWSKILENPEHPFVAVIGGAKLETKVPVIRNLLPRVDKIIIGGAMIFSFLKALGFEIGKSMVDEEAVKLARETLENSKDKIVLPEQIVVTNALDSPSEIETVPYNGIPKEMYGVDISPKAVFDLERVLHDAKTVVWNGPLGMFEHEEFRKGTEEMANILAGLQATIVVGGGDTAAVISALGLKGKYTRISSGGGASLALLGGQTLPAVEALKS